MDRVIAKIHKKSSAELWVSLRDFQGQQYVDVREHFLLADDKSWHPTKKGVMVPPDVLPTLIDGVERIEDTMFGTIHTVTRSANTEMRVSVSEYEHHRYAEIRTWYKDVKSQEMKPSNKGVTFNLEKKDDLLEALRDVEDELDKGEAAETGSRNGDAPGLRCDAKSLVQPIASDIPSSLNPVGVERLLDTLGVDVSQDAPRDAAPAPENGDSPSVAESPRQNWEMTLREWRETCLGLLDRFDETHDPAIWDEIVRLGGVNCRSTSFAHKVAFQKALQEGKLVPQQVLTDYSDLRTSQTKTAD